MGVMHSLAPVTETPPLVFTPHPVTLEGQEYLPVQLRDGETLGALLDRMIDHEGDAWEVKLGGVVVPVQMWDRVKPKHGHLIEVRGAVNRQVLYIVAMAVLAYFTMGAGLAAYGAAVGVTSAIGLSVLGAVTFAAGALLINKVLGPKTDSPAAQDRDSVYNIAGARNALRQYEPLGLLLGSTRVSPDILSMPYSWYEGNDQYLGMVLTPGINVDRFDDLYIGDTLLSAYEGVTVWTSGFPGMPEQTIPLYSNADTIAGGTLESDASWVTRTTSADTVRVMINLEYMIGDVTSEGKPYYNSETVQVEYRAAGSSGPYAVLRTRLYRNNTYNQKRDTIGADVPRGQYDIRVRRLGQAFEEKNGKADFQFVTMTSVQADDADYRGIPRIGIRIKATGQLNGTPDQIRAVFHQKAMPAWSGTGWETATDRASGLSNPGAQILQYARGFHDESGDLIAGMGLEDSMIDIPALQAFMLHCEAEGYTYDHWTQSVRSHAEMLDTIALAGFGQITWAAGRLSVAWAADGQPLSGVVNMATMKKGAFQVDYTLAGAADGVEYTYLDRTDWQTKTLRVPAPGVTVMLNPARLSGEGVSTEAHAAQLARYHLAQSLYQYKDISYSTDLEHMTYRRLSVLSLAHDMTKWGHGGRVVSAILTGDTATLTLDEPVPAPVTGDAYIGLRIPGERVYRVFKVAPFVGESDTLVLSDPWPEDADLPGDSDENPAHDTIWIYDFKATPGYRVRVVSIEPESGLKGARVAVVPESPEFWTYVKSGAYEPPVSPPQYPHRPVASNLVISENQIYVGSGEYTELTATFDVSGHVSHSVVFAGLIDEPLEEVAQTTTRTASWRIDQPGEYAVVVRPFDAEGNAGESVSGSYITVRADTPPPVFDWFEVQEVPGGVRKYLWGYDGSTTQSANLAGAEIRYTAGNVASPVWDDMTVLGDGFFTAGFEMVLPAAGTWTFAIRARNTSGILSTGMLRIVRTLQENLGQIIDEYEGAQLELIQDLAQEVLDRIAGDVEVVDLARDAAIQQVTARLGDSTDNLVKKSKFDDSSAGGWGGATTMAVSSIPGAARALRLDASSYEDENWIESGEGDQFDFSAMLHTGNRTGGGNTALVIHSVDKDGANVGFHSAVSRANAVAGWGRETGRTIAMPAGVARVRPLINVGGTGGYALATDIRLTRLTTADRALAAVTTAQEGRIFDVEGGLSAMASDVGVLTAAVGDQEASITHLSQVTASSIAGNAIVDGGFEGPSAGVWTLVGSQWNVASQRSGGRCLQFLGTGAAGIKYAHNHGAMSPVKVGQIIPLSFWTRQGATTANGYVRINARYFSASGTELSYGATNCTTSTRVTTYTKIRGSETVPPGAAFVQFDIASSNSVSGASWLVDDAEAVLTNEVTGAAYGMVGVTVDVNGHLTGYQLASDGTTGSFDIRADRFSIQAPGGGARTEYSNGNWRVYDAAGVLRTRMGVW